LQTNARRRAVWWSQGGFGAGDPQLNILLSFLHGKTDNPIRFAAFKKCGEGQNYRLGEVEDNNAARRLSLGGRAMHAISASFSAGGTERVHTLSQGHH
jgi:hypothetical protein